jgi:serine phosphatase RsbU (regulator of sigma subunit)
MTIQPEIPIESALILQELAEREAELAIINSVQEGLASHLDVQAIYNLVGDKVRDIFNYQVVMISTYDAGTDTMEHRYAFEGGEHIYAPGRYPVRGFRTQIVQTKQPVLVNTNVDKLAQKLGQPTIPGTTTPKSWLGVPMMVGDQVTGILSLQNIDRENAFDQSDVRLLQTLSASMSVALENARLFEETQRLLAETEQKAVELHIINSVQEELAKKLDIASIYNLVGEKLIEFFHPADVSILVYDQDRDLVSSPFPVMTSDQQPFIPYTVGGMGFVGYLLQTHQPLLINEKVDEAAYRFQNVYTSSKKPPQSVLYVPIMLGEVMHGAIVLKNMEREKAFSDGDVRLIKTLANSMSVALENARLWEQEELYRKALEREFEIGRQIQAGFLPDDLPQPEGWEIAASLKSAREVTGDFYDVFQISDSNIGLVIADVCDKGLGAALFMTLFRSLLRAVANIDFFTNQEYTSATSSTMRLNNAISLTNNYFAETHGKTSMFCTIFFGILDTHSGVLTYINAGHLPPILMDAQGIKDTLKVTGPMVGLESGVSFVAREAVIAPGDTLFAYTDGLTDTINPAGEYLTKEDIVPMFKRAGKLGELLEQIHGQVKDYSTGARQVDDITMLSVRRNQS